MNILKYYKAKSHPEMEPFPVLKRVWDDPECERTRRIKYLEDKLYYMSGQQMDETMRAYPEKTVGIPQDEWPDDLQDIWEYWDVEMAKIEKKRDKLYDEIIQIEKVRYYYLDPMDLSLMELKVDWELPHLNLKDKKWGIAKLMDTLDYKYKYLKNKETPRFKENASGTGGTILRVPIKDLPIELVAVDYASDEEIRQEVERLANNGVEWIEEQERMLLGLDANQ